MTSLLVLQRAMDQCGFQIIDAPTIMEELASARESVELASTTKEKIEAYGILIDLISRVTENGELPDTIRLQGFSLNLVNGFRYQASGYSRDYSRHRESKARSMIEQLNGAYRSIALDLDSELKQAKAASMDLEDLELREALVRAVKAEQDSYKKSVAEAKEKIFQIMRENAEKEGYSMKRNVFTKGKHAGREQYVLVRRG